MGSVFYTASLRASSHIDSSSRTILQLPTVIMGYFQWCLLLGLVSALCVLSARGEDLTQVDGQMKSVSIGPAGAWGIGMDDEAYYREGSYGNAGAGTRWTRVSKRLLYVDSGATSVWGVNQKHKVFYRSGISSNAPEGKKWILVDGDRMTFVSVSNKGHVWATNENDTISRRVGVTKDNIAGSSWEQAEGALVKISVGESGVWGVNKHNQVYYREGTYGDADTLGTDWILSGSYVRDVSSCDGVVMAVHVDGHILVREGITADNPTGEKWVSVPGKLSDVDCSNASKFWGVGRNNEVYIS